MTVTNKINAPSPEPTWWLAEAIGEANAAQVKSGFFFGSGTVLAGATVMGTIEASKVAVVYATVVTKTACGYVASTVAPALYTAVVSSGPLGWTLGGLSALGVLGWVNRPEEKKESVAA